MKRTTGFTLIEILIAILILSVVMSTVYAAYTGTFRIIGSSEYQGEIYAMARIAMERITKDLEAISPYGGSLEFISRTAELGGLDNLEISFRAKAHLSFDETNTTGGSTAIRYRVEEDKGKKGYILLRDDDFMVQDDMSTIKKTGFVVCDRIKSLKYTFYDTKGNEYESWDSLSGQEVQKGKAPVMVTIVLNLINPDNEDSPFTFMTRVYIPVNQGAL
jgi:prepilin-type N-terminal cleavage/methylation domain-containing protein